ncbi:TetR/AcrR family transcriptional regulator [Actinobacteria bacterium YIM 96077]|uniref:TetR/AcrR family transcriptional regulator n=1 Tax=Phytoactinopolyspora halophila TaxID=1981511 RepID=A0A329R303_9ACTN|nr:TetR/AcrR family transcriptional regulator [Phytoactinopolyspora halophila]AYY11847.1 TetR/AcrR family transcriptional regulator [Actinobacteria bacterium YIM 96077]RAW18921.1 TetR/AcrR family transcriptional regulator [Phytoactinopolyspora halophila]
MVTQQDPDQTLPPARPSRRERARAATIDEIKETALRLMHEHGNTDLRFSDIAREMGMTAPALYRYFADRDELLTALIVDAYDDLGTTVAEAREELPVDDLPGRFLAVAAAYRSWAKREPQQFALIFGIPVPGYVAPEEGPTTEAAKRAMGQLKALFSDASERGLLGKPLIDDVDDALAACAQVEHPATVPHGPPLPPETFQACLQCWSSLHGFVILETYGHFDFLPEDARDELFHATVRQAAVTSGFPWPHR